MTQIFNSLGWAFNSDVNEFCFLVVALLEWRFCRHSHGWCLHKSILLHVIDVNVCDRWPLNSKWSYRQQEATDRYSDSTKYYGTKRKPSDMGTTK
jgi:hypothetical protein